MEVRRREVEERNGEGCFMVRESAQVSGTEKPKKKKCVYIHGCPHRDETTWMPYNILSINPGMVNLLQLSDNLFSSYNCFMTPQAKAKGVIWMAELKVPP